MDCSIDYQLCAELVWTVLLTYQLCAELVWTVLLTISYVLN